jgi:hypothetical protein
MNVEPIINARFKKFRDSNDLNNMADGDAFERFVNHAIFTSHQPDAFSADNELLDKICVGGQNDMGIDGIAVKLNGLLVRDIADIKDILHKFKRANVEFIFVQSKFKPYFDKGELNNFVDGVRDFLSEKHRMPMNEKVTEMLGLKDFLLSDDITVMWEKSPMVRLYYVAMGVWRNSLHQLALSDQLKADIAALNTYEQIDMHYIDRDSLKSICDNNENTFTSTVNTIDTMSLTDVIGVTDSCMALIYASEFSKILTTEEGLIRKSLFDDNVRDFQGANNINKEIETTIKQEPSKFILLNNGITIVCDEFIPNNRKLTIKNPQIVNGCQTSHVIYLAQQRGLDISKVPLNVKIISTSDPEISNQIVRGTNRQNIVMDEAFETTKKFHKDLEDFITAISSEYEKIYYERRSKQFNHNPTIKQTQKFNLRILIQSIVGMFLNKPHQAHSHESRLLNDFANDIFQDHHSKLPYFTAAYAFLKIEALFRNGKIDKREFYAYRLHLLMALRESLSGKCPNINSEVAIDEHSLIILKTLKNDELFQKQVNKVLDVFKQTRDKWTNELKKSPHGIKDINDFTILLLENTRKVFKQGISEVSTNDSDRYKGEVMKILTDKRGSWFGFIARQPENIFFHSNSNRGLSFFDLEGKLVSYRISTNPRDGRLLAVDVELSKN